MSNFVKRKPDLTDPVVALLADVVNMYRSELAGLNAGAKVISRVAALVLTEYGAGVVGSTCAGAVERRA